MNSLDFLDSTARAGPALGNKMRRRRTELGLTQAELGGERFSKSYVSQIESGKVAPSHEALTYFAERLKRPVAWFLTDVQECISSIRLHLSDVQLNLRRGQHAEAAQSLRDAARLAMDLDDEHELARVHENAGHLYLSTGDISSAVLAYREGVTLYRQAGPAERLVGCICSLANALLAGSAYDAAQTELQGARGICSAQSLTDPLVLGRVDLVAGCLALAMRNHNSARRLLEQALTAFGGKDLAGAGETHLALGNLCAEQGDWAGARLHFEPALARLDGVAAPAVLAAAHRRMAETLLQLGEWERAVATMRSAGTISAGLSDAQGIALASVRLAEMEIESGQTDQAHQTACESAALLNYDPTGVAGLAAHPQISWRRLYGAMLTRVFAALSGSTEDYELAARHLGHGVDALSGMAEGLLLQTRLLHEQAVNLALSGNRAAASECYERALTDLERNWPGTHAVTSDYLDVARVPSPLWFR